MPACKRKLKPTIDFLDALPTDFILYQIIPFLDYKSLVRASSVSKTWKAVVDLSPRPGDHIPWIWLSDGQNDSTLLPPSDHKSAHHPTNITTFFGLPLAYHSGYIFVTSPYNDPELGKLVYIHNTRTNNMAAFPMAQPVTFTAATITWSQVLHEDDPMPTEWVAGALSKHEDPDALYICLPELTTRRYAMGNHVNDIIFHNGELFCITVDGLIVAISDFHNDPPTFRVVVPPVPDNEWFDRRYTITYYLLESPAGGLLVVYRDGSPARYDPSKSGPIFTVYQVDENDGDVVEVEDLGDQMLFIGPCCSRSIMYGSNATRYSFYKSGNIYYFSHDCWEEDYDRHLLKKFCMHSKTTTMYRHRLSGSVMVPVWIPPWPQLLYNNM